MKLEKTKDKFKFSKICMKALLLSGGRGTRMRPLTYSRNKHAILIANKPLILYPFEMIVEAGIKDIAVIVNETRREIEEILGDGKKWRVKVTYIYQDKPAGLAHALSLSEEFMGEEKFVMVLGDNILEKGIKKYVKYFDETDINGHILGVKVPKKEHKRYGMATVDKNFSVKRYIEKPGVVDNSKLYDPKSSYAVTGFYFFDSNVFKCFSGKDKIKPSKRGELEIASAFNWLIQHKYKVSLELVSGWYKDPGNPEDTLLANQFILTNIVKERIQGKVDKRSKIKSKVNIGKKTIIKNSILCGPLIIGNDCLIENSVIGPFTSIYNNTVIRNCKVENSIILGGVTLEDVKKKIVSSLIGWNAEILKIKSKGNLLSLLIGDNSVVRV